MVDEICLTASVNNVKLRLHTDFHQTTACLIATLVVYIKKYVAVVLRGDIQILYYSLLLTFFKPSRLLINTKVLHGDIYHNLSYKVFNDSAQLYAP